MPYLRSLAQQLGHEQGLLIAPHEQLAPLEPAPLEQLAPLEPAPLEQLAPLEPAPLEQLAPLEPAPLEQQPVGEPLEHFIVGEPALEQPEEAEAPTTVPDGLRPADTDVSAE
jgi:hypothetical protein